MNPSGLKHYAEKFPSVAHHGTSFRPAIHASRNFRGPLSSMQYSASHVKRGTSSIVTEQPSRRRVGTVHQRPGSSRFQHSGDFDRLAAASFGSEMIMVFFVSFLASSWWHMQLTC